MSEVEVQSAGYDETQFEWDNVHEEAPDQLLFTTIGDKYVGEYRGHELIVPDPATPDEWFVQLKWHDQDGSKVCNAGYELRTAYVELVPDPAGMALDKDGHAFTVRDIIAPGSVTRTELIKLVDVKQATPMKSYRVDVAKTPAPVSANYFASGIGGQGSSNSVDNPEG